MRILTFCFIILLVGCTDDYNEKILPVTGIYDAYIVGLTGPVSISVSYENHDIVLIDAPLDGETWTTTRLRVCENHEDYFDIEFDEENIGNRRTIEGRGYYSDYTIQLDYIITDELGEWSFTLIGSKL